MTTIAVVIHLRGRILTDIGRQYSFDNGGHSLVCWFYTVAEPVCQLRICAFKQLIK